jgi:predicted nucleic acid-binding protein
MRILVDTNVLVRSVERAHPLMRIARNSLRHLYEEAYELCVTPQNVSEFWNVCTRPLKMNGLGNGIPATDRLASRIESFFTIVPDSIETFRRWRELVVAHEVKGAKVHDARLVAAMMVHRINAILTFNPSDFVRFSEIKVLDPAQF